MLSRGLASDVRAALLRLGETEASASELVSAVPAGLVRDLERSTRWPFHPDDGIRATAGRVAATLVGRRDPGFREARAAELRRVFAARGLEVRDDSSFCEAYVSGDCSSTPEEVAAVMALTRRLLDEEGAAAWRRKAKRLEARMRAMHAAGRGSWEEVLQKVYAKHKM